MPLQILVADFKFRTSFWFCGWWHYGDWITHILTLICWNLIWYFRIILFKKCNVHFIQVLYKVGIEKCQSYFILFYYPFLIEYAYFRDRQPVNKQTIIRHKRSFMHICVFVFIIRRPRILDIRFIIQLSLLIVNSKFFQKIYSKKNSFNNQWLFF